MTSRCCVGESARTSDPLLATEVLRGNSDGDESLVDISRRSSSTNTLPGRKPAKLRVAEGLEEKGDWARVEEDEEPADDLLTTDHVVDEEDQSKPKDAVALSLSIAVLTLLMG